MTESHDVPNEALPKWDFRGLARKIPGADVECANRRLNEIYPEEFSAAVFELQDTRKKIQGRLNRVRVALLGELVMDRDKDGKPLWAEKPKTGLGRYDWPVVVRSFEECAEGLGLNLGLNSDQAICLLVGTFSVAPSLTPSQAPGPKGLGAARKRCFRKLVDLYREQANTDVKLPYIIRAQEIKYPEAAVFGQAAMVEWGLVDDTRADLAKLVRSLSGKA